MLAEERGGQGGSARSDKPVAGSGSVPIPTRSSGNHGAFTE